MVCWTSVTIQRLWSASYVRLWTKPLPRKVIREGKIVVFRLDKAGDVYEVLTPSLLDFSATGSTRDHVRR